MDRWKVILALTTMVIALACTSAHARKPAPPSFFGLVPNSGLQPRDYQMITQANVGAARVSLFWRSIEPRDDHFDWDDTDAMIGGFAARGIISLPQLFGSPDWVAANFVSPPVGSPAQQAQWMEFVSEAVRRYGPSGTYWKTAYRLQFPGAQPIPITTWQIWNEQNGPKHFYPTPDVNRYATLLRISESAISARDPTASILTGGTVSRPTGEGGVPAWRYVRNLLKVGGPFDHVALHPYARNAREIGSHIKKVRRVLKKGKKKKAQVWITEVGWSSGPSAASPKLSTTAKGQAKRLAKTYKKLKKKRKKWRIGGVYWYTWRDFGGGVCDWCPHAGLVTPQLGPKPAFTAYGRIAG
jgi:polysaccharide biosynthesis protein PslG